MYEFCVRVCVRAWASEQASERASEHVSSVCHHKLIIFPLSHRSSTCHHLSQRVCVSGHSGTSVTLCFQSPLNIHKKKKKKKKKKTPPGAPGAQIRWAKRRPGRSRLWSASASSLGIILIFSPPSLATAGLQLGTFEVWQMWHDKLWGISLQQSHSEKWLRVSV